MKRGGTTGDYTQEELQIDGDKNSEGDVPIADEDQMGMRSQSLSHQKSVKSNKGGGGKKNGDEDNDDDYDNTYQKYLYKAVASDRFATFHANLNEIYYELLSIQGGYFLRLETSTNTSTVLQSNGVTQGQIAKKVVQQAFQFSYDPLFKRFTRELRDQENKEILIDKYYLGLRTKKEDSKLEQPQDPNAHRYANMTYISFLNRQQRMLERGALVDDFDDDEEGQSEDDSNVSGGAASPDDKAAKSKQTLKPNADAGNKVIFGGTTAGQAAGANLTPLAP